MLQTKSFDQMVEKYQEMMFFTAVKILHDRQLAEDAVQEAWIKVFRFQIKLEKIDQLGAWLRTIISRTAIDLLRKEKRSRSVLLDEETTLENTTLCATEHIEKSLDIQCTMEEISECLCKASKKIQAVFHMKFIKGFQDAEIAEVLGITQSAVKTRLFRARQLIKKQGIYEMQPGA